VYGEDVSGITGPYVKSPMSREIPRWAVGSNKLYKEHISLHGLCKFLFVSAYKVFYICK
jgi:hypothetical protein